MSASAGCGRTVALDYGEKCYLDLIGKTRTVHSALICLRAYAGAAASET
jgi:hypothetical protein